MSSPARRGPAGGARRGAPVPASPAGSPAASAEDAAAGDSPVDDNPDADEMDRVEEESEGEDLLDEDNYADDYKQIAELDSYEADGLADEDDMDGDELAPWQREEAEREMTKRDRERKRKQGREIGALDTPQSVADEPTAIQRERRRRKQIDGSAVDVDENGNPITPAGSLFDEEEEDVAFVDLDDFAGPVADWIALDKTRQEIKKRFRRFLSEFKGDGPVAVYPAAMVKMGTENRCSLEVSFLHLSTAEPILAVWVADEPTLILEIFDEEATSVTFQLYPEYENIQQDVHVRMTELPIVDKIRDLRHHHLDCLVRVEGVVTRRTGVFPQLQLVTFNCVKCRALTGPYTQNSSAEAKPGRCPECQSNGPFIVNSQQTVYRNYQRVTLQESPGSVPAGRVPRQKDIILLHDLIDSCSPGELVDITGVYKHTFDAGLNTRNGFPVFHTVLQANFVSKHAHAMASFRLTDEDKDQILDLAKKPNIAQLVMNSIGPSIYGHADIKTALALAMFSGEPKQFENGHRIRGDINVLVLGDPGTAKSQFLKYAEKTAHRSVYTTGKGASAVGLTASVHRDPLTNEWTLEGGALVLADQGICLIDEFDKMNDQDRTSIHEAMEQQSISISKAGIITTLKARCSVIAAANPVMGRYDSSRTFAENVELTDAILSRFDVLCVVRDTVDYAVDSRLANFVVDSHMKARAHNSLAAQQQQVAPSNTGGAGSADAALAAAQADPAFTNPLMIPQALLRKYIHYARTHCHPKLTKIDDDKISKLYADLRRESMVTGGIPIAVRHIESIIRMSEAHAKMHLRQFVVEEDVDLAIRVMLESFISSQKFAVMRPLRAHFEKYLSHSKDKFELLLFALNALVNEALDVRRMRAPSTTSEAVITKAPVTVSLEEFRKKAADLDITTVEAFLASPLAATNGFKLDKQKKFITKSFQTSSQVDSQALTEPLSESMTD